MYEIMRIVDVDAWEDLKGKCIKVKFSPNHRIIENIETGKYVDLDYGQGEKNNE